MSYYNPSNKKERDLKANFLRSNKKHLKKSFSRQGLNMIFNACPEEWIQDFIDNSDKILKLFFEIDDCEFDKNFYYLLNDDLYDLTLFYRDAGVNIIIKS